MPPRTRRTPYASSAVRTYQPAIVFSFITFNSPKQHIVWYLIFFFFLLLLLPLRDQAPVFRSFTGTCAICHLN